MIITITVSDQIPHTDRTVDAQTAFTFQQMTQSLANSEIARLRLSVMQQIAAASGPANARVCSDGLVRVRKL